MEEEILEDNEMKIKEQFRSLSIEVREYLESQGSSVADIKSVVKYYKSDFKRKVDHCRTLLYLFNRMGDLEVLTYNHYSLLDCLIGEIKDEDIKRDMREKMDTYISTDFYGYLTTKKLVEILPYHLNSNSPDETEVEFDEESIVKLKTKLEIKSRKITNDTLHSYVYVLWDKIRKKFDIPSLTALIYSIVRGSVVIKWLIPPSWACCILSELLIAIDFFNENSISWVEINAIRIYDDKTGVIGNEVSFIYWFNF